MNLAADTINIPAPKFVDLGLSTIDELDKSAIICTFATRVRSPTDFSHGSTTDYIFRITTAVRDKLIPKSDSRYKTDFEIWR